MIGNWFKNLFQASETAPAPTHSDIEEYEGYSIQAEPIPEGNSFRTAGRIGRERDGEMRWVPFIRADQHAGQDAAIEHALSKARQLIDEQGESLLDRERL